MSRLVSFVVLAGIVVAIGIASFFVLASFILPIFMAILLVVMFRPLHEWIVARCGGHVRIASALTTAAILLIVLLPVLAVLNMAGSELIALVRRLDQNELRMRLSDLRKSLGLDLPSATAEANLDALQAALEQLRQPSDDGLVVTPLRASAVAPHVHRAILLARNIERELGLIDASDTIAPATTAPFSPTPAHKEAWASFRRDLDALDAFVGQDVREADAVMDQDAYRPLLDAAHFELATFRAALVGGPFLAWLKEQVHPDAAHLRSLRTRVEEMAGPLALDTTQVVGGFLLELVLGMLVLVLSLYYFLADGRPIVDGIVRLVPLDERYQRQLLQEFDNLSRAVVLSVLLAAVAQGLLAGIGFYFAGLGSIFLLTVLTMVCAMVPFVGAAAVWVSCCLWLLFYEGRPTAAIVLAVYGFLFVSMIDNLIRPLVLHGRSNLHPLLALLSVLGGVKALGPIGIFVGPMVVAFLQTLLVMLRTELKAFSASND